MIQSQCVSFNVIEIRATSNFIIIRKKNVNKVTQIKNLNVRSKFRKLKPLITSLRERNRLTHLVLR